MIRKACVRQGKRPVGSMNKLEAKYAEFLESERLAGLILGWRYESEKFRLADRTWYLPDFMVILPNGMVEFHEVKGFWRDDARVKIKVAAELFWEYTFKACTFDTKSKNWSFETF